MTDTPVARPGLARPRLTRPRLAVRAAIVHLDRLLLVNAYAQGSDLWALPGGGVEPGQSLTENLAREIREETGLSIHVGAPVLVNEFHDPRSGWHQVEIIFRADLAGGTVRLEDPEGVVSRARWVTRNDLASLRHKPDLLADAVWGTGRALYDPLELIVP